MGHFGSIRTKGQIRLTYTSHLGGSVQGADQANGHQAAESGHDELVTTLAEVDGGMVGSLCYSMKERENRVSITRSSEKMKKHGWREDGMVDQKTVRVVCLSSFCCV